MLDTFDIYGNFIGVKSRSLGVYHKPVWIWIINSKGEILVQKMSENPEKHPWKDHDGVM